MTVKTGILGAAGFTGRELLKILAHHPNVSVDYITSSEYVDKNLAEVFGELEYDKYSKLKFSAHPQNLSDLPKLDLLFLAVPDPVAMKWGAYASKELKIIDISGAFRLSDTAEFKKYYNLEHTSPETVKQAVYGMPEIYRKEIPGASLIANPGCYATSAILPLHFIKNELPQFDSRIIIDSKSGTSGAGGRKEKDAFPYSEVYENFKAYRVSAHQHIPEIALQIQPFNAKIKMTPHLLPLFRGILTCIYLTVNENSRANFDPQKIVRAFETAAQNEPFIRYSPAPENITLKRVQNTNFLDISFDYDAGAGILVIFSALDNLVKGAAGQAVQNMNLLFGFSETLALM